MIFNLLRDPGFNISYVTPAFKLKTLRKNRRGPRELLIVGMLVCKEFWDWFATFLTLTWSMRWLNYLWLEVNQLITEFQRKFNMKVLKDTSDRYLANSNVEVIWLFFVVVVVVELIQLTYSVVTWRKFMLPFRMLQTHFP